MTVRIPGDFTLTDANVYQFGAIKDTYLWPNKLIGVDPALHEHYTGRSIKIAILDSGLFTDHTDLPEHVLSKDFTGEGVFDGNGHGTHVRGIINMRLDERGYTGNSPNSNLLIGKVLESGGAGMAGWLAEGIYWAVGNGADIINCSLGMDSSDRVVEQAMEYAEQNNVMVVCAAGNDGGGVSFPASLPSAISVGAVDSQKNLAPFSNRGNEVDVVCPGVNILSTWIGRNSQYKLASGTSMATPFVCGLLALYLEQQKELLGFKPNVNSVKKWLYENAEDLGKKGEDIFYGNGLATVKSLMPETNKWWCIG